MGVLSKTPSLSQRLHSKDALTQLARGGFGKLCCVITRTVFARGAASLILAGALALGTSGCVFITPAATLIPYSPSDGIGASVGDIDLRNVVGIINESGDAISLMVTLVNNSSTDATVSMQFESGGEKTTIEAPISGRTTVSFGTVPDGEQIVILDPSVPAGALLPVYVQYGNNEGKELLVPVLEAIGDYAELGPVPAPTATPTPTPTAATE